MVDWFKKALLPAAGAAAAIPLLQDEGEAASIPWKTAENFLENKLGAQYKTVPQELKDNLRKIVSRDIPEEYGLKTPFGDKADLQFIKKTLIDDNRFKFDPTIMNNIRLGLTTVPEEIMSRANLDIKFLDPKSVSKGNIRPLGNTGFQVGFNPLHTNITGSGLGTAGHELGGHLPQLMKTHFGSFDPELDDKISFVNNAGLLNKAELRTLPYSPADKKSKVYEKATPEQKEIIDRAWKLYEDNSMERVARDMGDIFVKKGRQSDLASLKDYENFKKIYGEVSGNAYTKYNEENPELAAELIDRMKERGMFSSNLSKAALATPLAVAGTQLVGEGDAESGPVKIENIFRGGKKTVRDSLGRLIASALGSAPGMAWDLMKQYGVTLKKVFTGSPVNSEDTRNLLDIATLPMNAVKGNAALAGLNILWPDNKEFNEKKMVKEGIVYPANFIPRKDARGKVLIDTSTLNFDPLGQAMNNFNQYENEARTFFE